MRDTFENKLAQRKYGIQKRAALTNHERSSASLDICRKIAETDAFKHAKTALVYYPTRFEADVLPLLEYAEDKRFAYPYCCEKGQMTALLPDTRTPWSRDIYGMTAPSPEFCSKLSPEEIDIIILPCAAFDSDCRRIGMGAGVYDRYLKKCPDAYKLCAAFSVQKVERAAFDPKWDEMPDCIVTEKEVLFRE